MEEKKIQKRKLNLYLANLLTLARKKKKEKKFNF